MFQVESDNYYDYAMSIDTNSNYHQLTIDTNLSVGSTLTVYMTGSDGLLVLVGSFNIFFLGAGPPD